MGLWEKSPLSFVLTERFFCYIISNPSGRNSAVECHLAKVEVDGSNPFARSIITEMSGGIAKWLRQRSAKPLFSGSSPDAASNNFRGVSCDG